MEEELEETLPSNDIGVGMDEQVENDVMVADDCDHVNNESREIEGVEVDIPGVIPGIGRGSSHPVIEFYPRECDVVASELVGVDGVPLPDINTVITDVDMESIEGCEVKDSFYPYLQDGAVSIIHEVITKFVVIRDKYNLVIRHEGMVDENGKTVTEANKEGILALASKLEEVVANAVQLNDKLDDDIVEVVSLGVANMMYELLTTEKPFSIDNFAAISDYIYDTLITSEHNEMVLSYREQMKEQIKEQVIPNMIEDTCIFFNAPTIDLDNVLETIANANPDAAKYKHVKINDDLFSILLYTVDSVGLPFKVDISYDSKDFALGKETNVNLKSYPITEEEFNQLVLMYEDVTRWHVEEL